MMYEQIEKFFTKLDAIIVLLREIREYLSKLDAIESRLVSIEANTYRGD